MSYIPALGEPILLFAEECDPGILREENQDSVLHVRIAMGDLMLVADGIGGYPGGATSSRMVVEHFYAHLAALPPDYPVDNAIREAAARPTRRFWRLPRTRHGECPHGLHGGGGCAARGHGRNQSPGSATSATAAPTWCAPAACTASPPTTPLCRTCSAAT